jgi:hypothetical protein
MDFIPQPEDAKKFGLKWLKWHIYKYPNVALIALPVPFIFYKAIEATIRYNRELRSGTYVPNVVMNRYAICRPTDYGAKSTPSRYTN